MKDATEAIPNLIELLNDKHVYVKIYAHGALNKLTGKNFGYKNYADWKAWWDEVEKNFERKRGAFSILLRDYRRTSNTQGLVFLDARDFVSAARMFRDAIWFDPDVPDYWNNFGLALMALARHDRAFYSVAMECFLEAIKIDPSLPQPFMNIGQCFSHLGKQEQAHRWYHLAGERDPDGLVWAYFFQLASDCSRQGDAQRALEYLDWIRSRVVKIWSREESRQRDFGGSLGAQKDPDHESAMLFLRSCLPGQEMKH
jgi:tetratricopeptide (TPR) repeat protein